VQVFERRRVYGSHVHVSALGANCVRRVRQPSEYPVRVVLHKDAITERARVTFIAIGHDISRRLARRRADHFAATG
jgi:hypothetical protein